MSENVVKELFVHHLDGTLRADKIQAASNANRCCTVVLSKQEEEDRLPIVTLHHSCCIPQKQILIVHLTSNQHGIQSARRNYRHRELKPARQAVERTAGIFFFLLFLTTKKQHHTLTVAGSVLLVVNPTADGRLNANVPFCPKFRGTNVEPSPRAYSVSREAL